MPPLAVLDRNVQRPSCRSTKEAVKPTTISPDILRACQHCIAFISTCQAQYEAAQLRLTSPPPSSPPTPPDFSSLTAALTSTPSLSLAGSSYESIGHWLFHCHKLPQALTVLRSALSVHAAAGHRAAGWRVRMTIGRVMGAMEERAEGKREEVQQWWATLGEEVEGQELELESAVVYHAGAFHAKVAAVEREGEGGSGGEWWMKALEVWGRLELVPCKYRPSLRAPSTPAMQKHSARVQQAAEHVQATVPLLSMRGQLSLQSTSLQLASTLLVSINLFTSAAVPLLSTALLHLHSARFHDALALLTQAEELRQRKATATTAAVSYAYELLHCQVKLQLRPSCPLPSLPSPPSPAASKLLHCQALSVESLLRWKEGRGEESLAARKAEYRGWTQLAHHLMSSVRTPHTHTTASEAARPTHNQPGDSTSMRLEAERREERVEEDAAKAACEGKAVGEYDALLTSLSSVSSPHVYLVLSSFLSCLRHYATLLERCGHVRDAFHYLDLALSLSDGLGAERDRVWLQMLHRRIRTKRRQPQGPLLRPVEGQPVEVHEERIDAELQLESAALAETVGVGSLVRVDSSERLAVLARYVDVADAWRRVERQQLATQHYQRALALTDDLLLHAASSSSATPSSLNDAALPSSANASNQRTSTRRPARPKAKKPTPSTDAAAGSAEKPPSQPLHVYRAQVEAKLASLSLSASLPPFSPLDSLICSSSAFADGHERVDHAWALYWRSRAEPLSPSSPHPWSCAALEGAKLTSSRVSLLRAAVESCFGLAPPYLTRLLFLALSSATGLTSPLDAAFALNASIGITARHAVNRALHTRPPLADTAALTASLSALKLSSSSAEPRAGGLPAGMASRADALRPAFSFDGGVDADQQRFERELIGRMPLEWTVVSAALSDDDTQLLLSRVCSPAHGQAPLVLRLPLSPAFADAQAELTAVLHASGSMNEAVKGQSECSDDVRTEWWAGRFALDARMKAALSAIEESLLGGWRGALTGLRRSEEDRQRLQEAAMKVTAMLLPGKGESASRACSSSPLHPYVHALVDAAARLTDTQLDSALVWLLGWTDSQCSSAEEMAELLMAQRAGRVQLLQRVRAEVRAQQLSEAGERLPVILLLSSQLQQLPLESMPILSSVPVTRMPSYLFLLHHLTHHPSSHKPPALPSLSSHSFILNPSCDLPRTEATFTALLPALGLTRGLTGVHPSPSTFLSSLSSSDVFLYLGHGSGDQYVPVNVVERCASPPRVALLMGCSSGRLKGVSVEYEGWGLAAALLVAGSEVVVANLWDVTDGEIDRFTVRMLEEVTGRVAPAGGRRGRGLGERGEVKGGVGKGRGRVKVGKGKGGCGVGEGEAERVEVGEARPLSEVVMRSRSACRLRYLMGASPVVFGIPLIVQRH